MIGRKLANCEMRGAGTLSLVPAAEYIEYMRWVSLSARSRMAGKEERAKVDLVYKLSLV